MLRKGLPIGLAKATGLISMYASGEGHLASNGLG